MPSARPTPPIIRPATAIQTFEVSSVPSNAGLRTWSVARANAVVSHSEANANSTEPATEAANGFGCMRTYEPTNRMPRRKICRSTGWLGAMGVVGVVVCMVVPQGTERSAHTNARPRMVRTA